jgi:MFS family permease
VAKLISGFVPAGSGSAPMPPKQHTLLAMIVLSLIGIMNYFDRFLISIAAGDIKVAFQITDTQLGLLTGPAFVIIYAASTILAGRLADTRSRRVVLAGALLMWSAMTTSSAWAPTFLVLVLLRAGVGIGEGGANPATYSMISDLFPAQRRAAAIAAFHAISMSGVLLTFVVGGYLVSTLGWRAAFLAAGVPGFALAFVLLALVPEPSRGSFDGASGEKSSFGDAVRALGRNRAYMWLLAGASLGSFGTTGILQWLPLFFIRSHGMSVRSVGLLFGPSLALGLILGMIVGGWAANKLSRLSATAPLTFCVITNMTAAPLYWAVLWSPSIVMALVATFAAAATAVMFSPAFTAAVQNLVSARARGMAAAGCLLGTAVIAQAILPQLAGILSDLLRPTLGKESIRYALTILIVASVLAAFCFAEAARAIGRRESAIPLVMPTPTT